MTTDREAQERERFEKWVSAPPFEKDISRYSDRHVIWPNCYKDYQVHLAWDAWKAALTAQGGEQTASTVSVPSYQSGIRDGLLRAAGICNECEKFYRELAAKDESIEIRQSAVDVANGYRGAAYAIRNAAAKEGKS